MFIVKSKKQLMSFLITVFLGLSVGAVLHFSDFSGVFSANEKNITVLLDAGHGLPDGGAVGYSGTIEHEINLSIAEKTAEVLSAKGFSVIMTRNDEQSLAADNGGTIRQIKLDDMKKRKKLMKDSGADIFISIHMNAHTDSSASGLRLFYASNHPEISPLAELIQEKISETTGAKAYAVKTADESLFLMKRPPIAAILAECGFLTNPDEEKKLRDDEYRAKIAWAIACAAEEYYK